MNNPGYALTISQYVRICLNNMLKKTEYASTHLKNQSAEYGRILDVSDAVLSIRSLYILLSSYYISMLRHTYSEHCQTRALQ